MRNRTCLFIYATAAALAASGAPAANQGHAHHHGDHHHSPAGGPGDPAKVSQVFKVSMLDSMRFEPAAFEVTAGQTVKFVVTNNGKTRHEFGIGTHDEQAVHAEMMLADPHMKHEDGTVITVEPGKTKALVWRFANAGEYEAGCQVPGHYPAGMKATIAVRAR